MYIVGFDKSDTPIPPTWLNSITDSMRLKSMDVKFVEGRQGCEHGAPTKGQVFVASGLTSLQSSGLLRSLTNLFEPAYPKASEEKDAKMMSLARV
jgi:hypothetical protein